MSILEIVSGKKKQPINMVLIGTQGIGKSTFAAKAPSPVFLGAEETGEMDVARFPKPSTYSDLLKQLDYLITAKDLHYQTVVIDTLDSVEALVHKEILDSDPKKTGSMVAALGGYGRAFDVSANKLLEVRERLKTLRDQRGMNVILIAHAKKSTVTDTIIGMTYESQELAMHGKAQTVFTDWVSAVLFATYIVHPTAGTNSDKIFAMGDGERVLLTEKRPGHSAKNRFNLPYQMPLDFPTFKAAVDKFYDDGPNATDITATIEGLCANVDEELKGKVATQVKSAKGDLAKLQKIELRLREVIQNAVLA